MEAHTFLFLSILCNGVTFQIAHLVGDGKGVPSSGKCLKTFLKKWVAWAGWPTVVSCDRGLHNRGEFARGFSANGVYIRQAGLENPEAIGRAERHQGTFKEIATHVIK